MTCGAAATAAPSTGSPTCSTDRFHRVDRLDGARGDHDEGICRPPPQPLLRRHLHQVIRRSLVDFERSAVSVTRGLVSIGYELKISPGKTPRARRRIDLDPTTVCILRAWKEWQAVEQTAAGADPGPGWVFAEPDGQPVHPHSVAQACDRIAARADLPPGRTLTRRRRPRSMTWAFAYLLVAGAGFEPATFGL